MNLHEPWPDVFMNMARIIARRSKDETKVGAVLVDPARRIIALGFNGPPPRFPDTACPRVRDGPRIETKYPYVIHAEENALWFGAETRGMDGLIGSTMFVTARPCSGCVLRAVRAKVDVIIYGNDVPQMCDETDWEIARRIAILCGLQLIIYGGF
jgi:dCMP deaminase